MNDKKPDEAIMSEKEIDENLKQTFPASDPPSWTLGTDHRTDKMNGKTDALRKRLTDVRGALLHLHKLLLDRERDAYERARGRVKSGELLQLVISHEQFAWLHSISELIVRIDELLDAEEPFTSEEARALLAQVKTLLKSSESGTPFERKYDAALQNEPDVLIAHRKLMQMLETNDWAK